MKVWLLRKLWWWWHSKLRRLFDSLPHKNATESCSWCHGSGHEFLGEPSEPCDLCRGTGRRPAPPVQYWMGHSRPWWHLCCNGDNGGWRTRVCDYLERWRYLEDQNMRTRS
jgi:hypothetical protein